MSRGIMASARHLSQTSTAPSREPRQDKKHREREGERDPATDSLSSALSLRQWLLTSPSDALIIVAMVSVPVITFSVCVDACVWRSMDRELL